MKEIYKIPKGQNVATSKGWKNIDTEIEIFNYETEQIPENIEDVKVLLENLKIKHHLFYVNDKDYQWQVEDKIKILRAIVINFKTKFDDAFTSYTITIDNENTIIIDKREYDGIESLIMELSTMEQTWNIFINKYKDVLGEIK